MLLWRMPKSLVKHQTYVLQAVSSTPESPTVRLVVYYMAAILEVQMIQPIHLWWNQNFSSS
jgi:hypothetical protein